MKMMQRLTFRNLAFHILFWGLHWGLFAYGWYQQDDARLAPLNELQYSIWISRGSGLVLSLDALLLPLPMCRNILTFLRPRLRSFLDDPQWIHRQIAYATLSFTIIHVSCHYINFFNVERLQVRPEAAVQIHYTQAGGITGHIMLVCMYFMYTTAHHRVRQQSYETFWYTHHLFIPFFLALYTHATGCFVRDTVEPFSPFAGDDFWAHCLGYQGFRWELFGGFFYLVERLYREIRSRRETKLYRLIKHPYDTIELQFKKPSMQYKPGQWLFINVPEVSKYQWHPFTITSCPHDDYISIHVRQVGDWTKSLANLLGCGPAQGKEFENLDPLATYYVALSAGQTLPRIRIDGPYGAPAEDVLQNDIAVLIGTGIGISPWASVLKNIWHLRASARPPRRLKRVELVWVCRETTAFEWFKTLLSSLEAQSAAAAAASHRSVPEFLRYRIHLTAKLDHESATNIYLNSIEQGQEIDPLTGLRTSTSFGRPDFKRILATIRDDAIADLKLQRRKTLKNLTIGCYYCGPPALAASVETTCSELSKKSRVRFKFWKEHF
ncbi:NADPH oxidase [Exophiala aquamarina CBS 119918]|uniref:NADPH oxidase n=1 Tax=Exophiala aquamarina CBS 119918 TaxID=1182545 RepID=A0A072NY60_9EURO|nr:NADPH oxidase [Exophiala aquamarina CBS 119918]KEF52784.1 NADPH oxidase [Exophiala aquamarina CBS 119918]